MKKLVSGQEMFFISIGFIASMLHWSLCVVYFAALILYFEQGTVGCLKGLLIVTTRGILSTAVSSGMTSIVQMEKWALIFLFSFYILYAAKAYYRENMHTKNLRTYVAIFVIYIVFSSLCTSSYPVVSIFKAIAYAIPFCAIVTGVSVTSYKADWINYLYNLLTPIIIMCAIAIPFGQLRIVNDSFQGVINHPNLMGIFGSIYIGVTLYNLAYGNVRKKNMARILMALSFYMIYISESRTGMFSAVIMLIVHFISLDNMSKYKTTIAAIVVVVFAGIYFANNPELYADISSEVTRFVYKRDTDDILESRRGQVDASQEKYDAHPILGAGFSVPYEEGVTDYQFSMSLTYEAGNILIAVLGDCGILGSIIFGGYMLHVLLHTKQRKWVLFFLPIVVSFGEMAFFATNNIAIYYYLLYGICLTNDEGERNAA